MITLLTCFLGFFFAYERRINLYIIVFLFSLFLMPLLTYLLEPAWFQYRGYVPIFLTIALFLTHANILLTNSDAKYNLRFLIYLLVAFTVILTVCAAINNYELLRAILYFRHFFWPFLLYIILVSIGCPQLRLGTYVEIVIIMQVVMAVVQYLGGESFSKSLYFWEMVKDGKEVALSSESLHSVKGVLVSGTLGKVTILGNTLSLCLTYWLGCKLVKGSRMGFFDIALFVSAIGVVVATGTRASLLTCLTGLALSYIFITDHPQKTVARVAVVIGLLFLLMPFLVSLGHNVILSNVDYGKGYLRSMSVFGVIDDLFGDNEATHLYTLQRSVNILKFFRWDSLLWGTGIYMNNPSGYGSGIASLSDVQLFFIIVEFGVVVLFLCLMPHLFCLNDIRLVCGKNTFKMCLILLVVLFMQTIVDEGIFNPSLSYTLFMIFAYAGINSVQSKPINQIQMQC